MSCLCLFSLSSVSLNNFFLITVSVSKGLDDAHLLLFVYECFLGNNSCFSCLCLFSLSSCYPWIFLLFNCRLNLSNVDFHLKVYAVILIWTSVKCRFVFKLLWYVYSLHLYNFLYLIRNKVSKIWKWNANEIIKVWLCATRYTFYRKLC